MRIKKNKNSNLLLFDNALVLPKPWWAGKLSSARGMSQRKCCCGQAGCIIFSDNFGTDDLAANWTQSAGTWTIGSSVLSTNSANAILLCNTEYPSGTFHNYVVKVDLIESTNNISRIIVNYGLDGSGNPFYTYIAVVWLGVNSYVYIQKNTGSALATSETFTPTNNEFKVCVTANAIQVVWENGTKTLVASTSSTENQVGLGTGTNTGTIDFDTFSFEKHYVDISTCEQCQGECSGCVGSNAPLELLVTFSGAGQAYWNDSFILDYKGKKCLVFSNYTYCYWEYVLPSYRSDCSRPADIQRIYATVDKSTGTQVKVWILRSCYGLECTACPNPDVFTGTTTFAEMTDCLFNNITPDSITQLCSDLPNNYTLSVYE